MTSPLRRKAEQLAAEAALPGDNWLARRQTAIDGHKQSVENSIQALRLMGRVVLAGKISTNLLIEHKGPDINNTRASEKIGHISCQVIPALGGTLGQSRLPGLGFSWSPDIALQIDFIFSDKYDYSQDSSNPMPTGNVELAIDHRSWGRISDEETQEISALSKGYNTWAKYADQGFWRHGTNITTVRETGAIVTPEEAEAMLAPLAPHVINYFDLIGKPDWATRQTPGNFSSL